MQKTIVFCANEDHADRMRNELAKLNQDMVQQNPDYCSSHNRLGCFWQSKLKHFISVSSKYPVIATTSKLCQPVQTVR